MTRGDELWSCEKSALGGSAPAPSLDPLVLIPDATTVTYLGLTRLDVHGPDGRRLVVVFEQGATT